MTLGMLKQVRSSVTLVNNTLYSEKIGPTSGGGIHWLILRVKMHNGDNVARVCSVRILEPPAGYELCHTLGTGSLNAGVHSEMLVSPATSIAATGNSDAGYGAVIIAPGNKLELEWAAGGASAGGTAYYSVDYQEYLP